MVTKSTNIHCISNDRIFEIGLVAPRTLHDPKGVLNRNEGQQVITESIE